MLAIRMQRTGRKGHAMFRIVVQDSRRTPSSGKVVARLGNYDPHAKSLSLDKEKAAFYLNNGAQPSDRAARLLKQEGVKLPGWVKLASDQKREVRNPEKRRSTRPEEEQPAAAEPETASEAPAEQPAADAAEAEAKPEAEAAPSTETEETSPAEADSKETKENPA